MNSDGSASASAKHAAGVRAAMAQRERWIADPESAPEEYRAEYRATRDERAATESAAAALLRRLDAVGLHLESVRQLSDLVGLQGDAVRILLDEMPRSNREDIRDHLLGAVSRSAFARSKDGNLPVVRLLIGEMNRSDNSHMMVGFIAQAVARLARPATYAIVIDACRGTDAKDQRNLWLQEAFPRIGKTSLRGEAVTLLRRWILEEEPGWGMVYRARVVRRMRASELLPVVRLAAERLATAENPKPPRLPKDASKEEYIAYLGPVNRYWAIRSAQREMPLVLARIEAMFAD